MAQQYNQWTAMWAITKAALRATFKSPQAVFFSLFFPIVLIMVFGALTGSRGISLDIALEAGSDTSNIIYDAIKGSPVLKVRKGSESDLLDMLKKGRITALINIKKIQDASGNVKYDLHLKSSSASQNDLFTLQAVLNGAISKEASKQFPEQAAASRYIEVSQEQVKGREYKTIDFYLPGMLGFSLIGAAVFGVAFVFFSLRETLVLKRMFATPVRKGYIVLGESIARVLFQLVMAIVLILFGTYAYGFTLAHGWITFVELLALCLLGLIVFIGFGFIISSIAKNQNVIPIYANLFMFPQYFLSGTFFSKTLLPAGMQAVVQFLPLTALNDAMRKVSFEGVHLNGVGKELLILFGWCLFAYGILIKVFKWE